MKKLFEFNGIKIFAVVNICIGLLALGFLIFNCLRYNFFVIMTFLFVFFGWVTDNPFGSAGQWFLLTIVERGSLIALYIFSLYSFWSGIGLLKMNVWSRKWSIFYSFGLVVSFLIFYISGYLYAIVYQKSNYIDYNVLGIYSAILFCLLIYLFSFLRCLFTSIVKEQFNDNNVKFPYNHLIFPGVVILLPIFWQVIIKITTVLLKR